MAATQGALAEPLGLEVARPVQPKFSGNRIATVKNLQSVFEDVNYYFTNCK
jgi:hypothetical protein